MVSGAAVQMWRRGGGEEVDSSRRLFESLGQAVRNGSTQRRRCFVFGRSEVRLHFFGDFDFVMTIIRLCEPRKS